MILPRRLSSVLLVSVPILSSLVSLTACAPLKVRMGLRTPLEQTSITSIRAALAKEPAIAPGEKAPLIVSFTGADGRVLETEGKGHGKVLWSDLKLDATVVSANNKGVLSLPADPRVSDGQRGHVTITVPSHPDLRAELEVPLRYDYPYAAYFTGSAGNSGFDGTSGIDGSSGMSGSLDPAHPSSGGDGGNGSKGSDGSRGRDGSDAPAVQVRVTLKPGASPVLLEVEVSARGAKSYYLVDPQEGSLTVSARGGDGGRGGTGGRGGHGGSGGIGSPSGRSGMDGSSGSDGSRGSDGHDGKITVIYDPQAGPYLSAIRGFPKPVMTEQAVPALW